MEISSKATVLVVDDMPDNIMVLDEILSEHHEVIAATSGEKALKIIRSANPPDLVLLDVMMPGMDGFQVCREIKENDDTAVIPVVMVTALSGHEDRLEALNVGADDFLTKPIDSVEVVARVKSLLRVKKLHNQLQHSFTELKRSEELRENLTHMIIHDLRTPLTGVIGALSLLEDNDAVQADADAGELQQMAAQNSDKLLMMINDLLDITKMEGGELRLQRTAVDAKDAAADVENTVRAVAQMEEIEVIYEVAPELPKLSADRDMLGRVLVNLVANALKFSPPHTTVRLIAERAADGFLKLTVRDSGPGIPAGYEEKIFEKFGQVEAGERKKLSTGLGLTFCKMAVEAHGGRIWVESAPEKGSDFCVLWPAA